MKSINALLLLCCSFIATAQTSPKVVIEPVPYSDVIINDSFWKPRLDKHAWNTLRVCIDQIETETGRMRNFERAAQRSGKHEGIFFDDSDVYKAMEGMAYSLVHYRNPIIEKKLDEWIDKIAAAQLEDGYINTYYTLTGVDKRWTDMDKHEMYCAGHLIEAAIAYQQATGKTTLLAVAIKMADHIDRTFGPHKRHWVTGHPEIELALVKLYHATKQKKYLNLAAWLLEERGRGHGVGALWGNGEENKLNLGGASYCQDDQPVDEQTVIRGHAVRATYLYCGMADVAALTGNSRYMEALEQVWRNVVQRKMYVTGGIGSSKNTEGFEGDYILPNKEAYCETCASVGMILWNARMNTLTGHGKYINVLERALYNGALAGVNLEGDRFFYVNPLASDGNHHRQAWYGCACCPSQICRFLPSVGGYIYGKNSSALFVNLYISSETNVKINNNSVAVSQESNYPWEGSIKLKISPATTEKFSLYLRLPRWSENTAVGVNGKVFKSTEFKDGYAIITRKWKKGDVVELNLDMETKITAAAPQVITNWNQRAIQRGPLVYCMEEIDNPDLGNGYISPKTTFEATFNPDLLNGVVTITATNPDHTQLHFIPYYGWDNRAAGKMEVWTSIDEEEDLYYY